MLLAFHWRNDDKRPTFCGATVAPSLFERRDFFQKALKVTGCQVLEVISHDLQASFPEGDPDSLF